MMERRSFFQLCRFSFGLIRGLPLRSSPPDHRVRHRLSGDARRGGNSPSRRGLLHPALLRRRPALPHRLCRVRRKHPPPAAAVGIFRRGHPQPQRQEPLPQIGTPSGRRGSLPPRLRLRPPHRPDQHHLRAHPGGQSLCTGTFRRAKTAGIDLRSAARLVWYAPGQLRLDFLPLRHTHLRARFHGGKKGGSRIISTSIFSSTSKRFSTWL